MKLRIFTGDKSSVAAYIMMTNEAAHMEPLPSCHTSRRAAVHLKTKAGPSPVEYLGLYKRVGRQEE